MIILIDAEEAFDEIQHPVRVGHPRTPRTGGNELRLLRADILFAGESPRACLWIGIATAEPVPVTARHRAIPPRTTDTRMEEYLQTLDSTHRVWRGPRVSGQQTNPDLTPST